MYLFMSPASEEEYPLTQAPPAIPTLLDLALVLCLRLPLPRLLKNQLWHHRLCLYIFLLSSLYVLTFQYSVTKFVVGGGTVQRFSFIQLLSFGGFYVLLTLL
jgi:hypothetical protein